MAKEVWLDRDKGISLCACGCGLVAFSGAAGCAGKRGRDAQAQMVMLSDVHGLLGTLLGAAHRGTWAEKVAAHDAVTRRLHDLGDRISHDAYGD